jgi:curved DNA-binding protein
MNGKDYYKSLGVAKNATEDEIKKAYRKLAMKYHPDTAGAGKGAEEKFKEINEAYAVLGNKEKRKEYDIHGSEGFQQRFSQEDIFKGFNFDDILRGFRMEGGLGARRGTGRRFTYSTGADPFGDAFGGAFGGQGPSMRGQDLVYEMPLTLEEAINGSSKTVSLNIKGKSEKVTVKIPKGISTGKKIRLQGRGEPSPAGGPAGDLYIQARLLPHPIFEVEGKDLYVNREIKLTEALLGTTVTVPLPDGKERKLKLPPGTRHQTKMRMARFGLPEMDGSDRGDLYVRILVETSKALTPEQAELVRRLAETGL